MVNKRDQATPAPDPVVPKLPTSVPVDQLQVPWSLGGHAYDTALSGSPYLWDDYEVGEKIDHVDGNTIEEADHMMATRLYQNLSLIHI